MSHHHIQETKVNDDSVGVVISIKSNLNKELDFNNNRPQSFDTPLSSRFKLIRQTIPITKAHKRKQSQTITSPSNNEGKFNHHDHDNNNNNDDDNDAYYELDSTSSLRTHNNNSYSRTSSNNYENQRRRASLQENNKNHHHNHRHHHSSTSPASSSASDSAFSQSQTTLESESEQSSNCFSRNSIDKDNNSSSRYSESVNSSSMANEKSLPPDKLIKDSLPNDDGDNNKIDGQDSFNIIWRNLSYRLPDKRLSKLTACIKRYKDDYLWKSSEQGEEEADENNSNIVYDNNCSKKSKLSSTNKDNNDDGGPPPPPPPLKAPISGKPRKVIFENLNGCVKSGELTAILGPSGAGKTTFLKCLTNTIVDGVTGSIDIVGGNGGGGSSSSSNVRGEDGARNSKKASHHLKLCIIPQKDYLFDNLTVMENLVFASRIKNTQANFRHLDNVERVAKLLGLQACLRLKTSKLSGGQYKRVSIAQELLSKPDILILDEPTSGLDSLTCFRTVSVLRDLVNMSRSGLMPPLAIVMTIHQPQIKIFNLFHHVYIMSSMGQCVYEGKPEFLIDTVANCCKLLPPPDDLNPASFIIDLASEVYGIEPIEKLSKLQRKNSNSNSSIINELQQKNIIVLDDGDNSRKFNNHNIGIFVDSLKTQDNKSSTILKFEDSNNNNNNNVEDGRKFVCNTNRNTFGDNGELRISDRLKRRNIHDNNFWLHTYLLVNRLWISMWRDPLLTTTRVTFHLIIPFVFYFIYSQKSGSANACPHVEREFDFQTMTSEENMHRLEVQHNELILTFENVSLFFLLLYSFSMCVLAVTALSFPLNMQILLKETSNGWYSMPRFVMAKTLADLPIELTMPMISVSIAYYLTGQPSSYLSWRMLTVTAVMTLCSLISQTQGLLFGAYFMNNVQAAVFVSQASSLPWIMLSGFTTRVSELPTILQWLSFGSIYRLGIESIVAVRYGFEMCPCDEDLVNDNPAKIVGIPDQLRSLMRYYLDMYADNSSGNNAQTAASAVTTTPSSIINSTSSTILLTTTTSNITSSSATSMAAVSAASNSTGDIFEKIASTLSRANTYGLDIANCHDVRPFIMSAREVDERTLPTFLLILVFIFVALKILLFCIVRFRAG